MFSFYLDALVCFSTFFVEYKVQYCHVLEHIVPKQNKATSGFIVANVEVKALVIVCFIYK